MLIDFDRIKLHAIEKLIQSIVTSSQWSPDKTAKIMLGHLYHVRRDQKYPVKPTHLGYGQL